MEPTGHSGTGVTGVRRHPRFQFEVDVKISSKSTGVLHGRTDDISESGISAILKIEVPVNEVVELRFTLATAPVTIYAVVRHRSAFRYGFQFVEEPVASKIIRTACGNMARTQMPV